MAIGTEKNQLKKACAWPPQNPHHNLEMLLKECPFVFVDRIKRANSPSLKNALWFWEGHQNYQKQGYGLQRFFQQTGVWSTKTFQQTWVLSTNCFGRTGVWSTKIFRQIRLRSTKIFGQTRVWSTKILRQTGVRSTEIFGRTGVWSTKVFGQTGVWSTKILRQIRLRSTKICADPCRNICKKTPVQVLNVDWIQRRCLTKEWWLIFANHFETNNMLL